VYISHASDLIGSSFARTKTLTLGERSYSILPIQTTNQFRQPYKHQFTLEYTRWQYDRIIWARENPYHILILVMNEYQDKIPNVFKLESNASEKEINRCNVAIDNYILTVMESKHQSWTLGSYLRQKKTKFLLGDIERTLQDFYDPLRDQPLIVQKFFLINFFERHLTKYHFDRKSMILSIQQEWNHKEGKIISIKVKSRVTKEYTFDNILGRVSSNITIEQNPSMTEYFVAWLDNLFKLK
jgi:hypothetical protein